MRRFCASRTQTLPARAPARDAWLPRECGRDPVTPSAYSNRPGEVPPRCPGRGTADHGSSSSTRVIERENEGKREEKKKREEVVVVVEVVVSALVVVAAVVVVVVVVVAVIVVVVVVVVLVVVVVVVVVKCPFSLTKFMVTIYFLYYYQDGRMREKEQERMKEKE